MYSASQWAAVGLSLVVCGVAFFYADELARLIPADKISSTSAFTDAEHALFLASMQYHARGKPHHSKNRLAFCCSADVDVSIRATDLMDKFDHSHDIQPRHHERINSNVELMESFGHYFSQGAAAEQSMSSAEAFRKVVTLAKSIPTVESSLGGNAAQMAQRAAYEGNEVLLGGAVGADMRALFHPKVQVVGSVDEGGHEDVHLVLEYAKGDAFNNLVSPRANRYYLNHDVYNARLSVLEDFDKALESFKPNMVVIGGLQLMEVETDEDRRYKRLQDLSAMLQRITSTKSTLAHYEFAAASDFTLFDDTVKLVLPYVHSVGFNEQELAILHHFLVTGEELVTTSSRPSVSMVTSQLADVIAYAAKAAALHKADPSAVAPLHRLTRLHFHTLQFHILCQKRDSGWQNPMTALMQAALISSKLACGDRTRGLQGADISIAPSLVEILLPRSTPLTSSITWDIDPRSPTATWTEGDFQCFIVPMLACKKPDHTCGLGDNISGMGMAYHGHEFPSTDDQ
ncbi:hypothetical protein H310_06966 [Aphanomyces invadans]|uniref:ADP-dependent glucokinase n=1 Tax=Aphanomyces invadans TaxID=157072 RepID=A0A024U6F8_9STRA|nr:hypothetical protein H310_06966 [Aphanomyces invadans]ETW01452.1 hypothetical protein H310_06966 [Aphanomyces invadans]|eukprot:XP_008870450.1 hypothetical protein H310_06966 [Aphanomyces invadans]